MEPSNAAMTNAARRVRLLIEAARAEQRDPVMYIDKVTDWMPPPPHRSCLGDWRSL